MRILKKTVVVLAVVVVLLVVVGYLLPRRVHVERSAVIAAPRATVFTLVNGYRLFNKWSPWVALDPDTKYAYEGPEWGVGAKMSWVGDPKKVGTGSQVITESRPYETVATELDFGAQGKATSRFTLVPEADATRVTWGLDADMGAGPVGRYFGLMMNSMVGKDYEKGLAGLKDLAEHMPKADFAGLEVETIEAAPVTVAYVSSASGKGDQEIAAAIGAAYAQVGKFMAAGRLRQAGAPITINTKWDETGYAFDAAVPLDRAPDKEPAADSPVKVKQTYAGKALKVVHKGAYRGMQSDYDRLAAYAAAHGYEKPAPTWDEYVSDPGRTPEPELITNIYMPVK